ncbi:hypothetical protein BZA05DRAFT_137701 [Tricharina praecox]|uniref:uncharacterized protein n=1 Tax=Tricharina praecox TaxID=43433 RepID=UPI0022204CBA|nr:uncharacterized protein BZA05DRAFT_137701 [Tricharina praecox]KAI5846060.1 hypothetical protein BZA05DRAFT_137701 [Tricharina praecox]
MGVRCITTLLPHHFFLFFSLFWSWFCCGFRALLSQVFWFWIPIVSFRFWIPFYSLFCLIGFGFLLFLFGFWLLAFGFLVSFDYTYCWEVSFWIVDCVVYFLFGFGVLGLAGLEYPDDEHS